MRILVCASLCAALATAQDAPPPAPLPPPLPKPGDAAPALQFDHVLGADAAAVSSEALRGKVVVLEFSTSWCGGCRTAVPHWNALAKELAGEPIVLLSVSNETAALAESFQREVGLATPLAVDLDGSLFEAFGVPGLPDAVVLDAQGRIAAFADPRSLEAAALRKLSAGGPATFDAGKPRQRRNWNHQQPLGDGDVAPGTFSLAPSPKPAGIVRHDAKTGTLRCGGVPLRTLLATVLECAAGDVELAADVDAKGLFDLVARGGDGTLAAARELARNGLARDLGLAIATKARAQQVLVLARLPEHAPPPPPQQGKGGSARAGEVRLGAVTAARLAQVLRPMLPLPVVDETGLAQPFAVDLQWDADGGVAALREALAPLGLTLTEATRPVAQHRVAKAAK